MFAENKKNIFDYVKEMPAASQNSIVLYNTKASTAPPINTALYGLSLDQFNNLLLWNLKPPNSALRNSFNVFLISGVLPEGLKNGNFTK